MGTNKMTAAHEIARPPDTYNRCVEPRTSVCRVKKKVARPSGSRTIAASASVAAWR